MCNFTTEEVIAKIDRILSRSCIAKKCKNCKFRHMDGCKEMYTIAQLEQLIEDLKYDKMGENEVLANSTSG